MAELPPEVNAIVQQCAAEGDQLAEVGQLQAAIVRYQDGIDALPEPKTRWHAFLWFEVAIGDAHFLGGDHAASLPHWLSAIRAGGLGNPFVHFRRGQCLYELGRQEEASDEFARALILGGVDLFDRAQKHLEFITGLMELPPHLDSWDDWMGCEEDEIPPEYLDPSPYQS